MMYDNIPLSNSLSGGKMPETAQKIEPFDSVATNVDRLIEESKAVNTKRAYASDMAYIKRWAQLSFGWEYSLPMSERDTLLFITDHLQGMDAKKEEQLLYEKLKAKPGLHSIATVRRRLAALTVYHRDNNHDCECDSKKAKQLLRALAKSAAEPTPQRAITRDVLESILETCDKSPRGIRDRAILLLAWASGGRRRSEVALALYEHLTCMGDDYLLRIPSSNSKTGKALDVPVKGRAAQALRDWLLISATNQGPLFRSISRGNKISANHLSGIDINRIVKKHCKAAGFDEKLFGAHSLRSGFLTQGARERVALADLMALSGHQSVNIAMRYIKQGAVLSNPAAAMLG
jgi:integrase